MQEFNNVFNIIAENKHDFLITGPPGTNKHLFLSKLVSHLINKKNVSYESILVFTFNRKTAKYYRDNLVKELGADSEEISFVTFYSFCLEILSKIHYENYLENILKPKRISDGFNFDFNDAQIKLLNAPEQLNLLNEVISEIKSKEFFRISKLLSGNENSRSNITGEIFDYIIKAQESLLKPSDTSKIFSPYFKGILFEINKIYSKYDKKLDESKVLDYGKLLQKTVDALKNDKRTFQRHLKLYKYIIVDDVQELNNAQFEIIKCISSNNVIYFGNDDESIFSFRSSNTNNYFGLYEKLYPDNVLFLDDNTRNSSLISDLCERFISKNSCRLKKNFNIYSHATESEILIRSFNSKYEELSFIEDKIFYLNKIKGVSLKNIAIIIKGLDSEADVLEDFLNSKKIPFYFRSSRSVLKSRYVRFIINIFKFVSYYEKDSLKDDCPFIKESSEDIRTVKSNALFKKIIYSGLFDFDPLLFKKVEEEFIKENRFNRFSTLYDYISNNKHIIKSKNSKNSSDFISIISFIENILNNTFRNVLELAYYVVKSTQTILSSEISNYESVSSQSKNLINTLGGYLNSLKKYCISNPASSVTDYCNYIENLEKMRFIEEVEESINDSEENEGIRIISFFDTKIKEFDAVFIPFLNKGYFPSLKDAPQIYEPEIFNMISQKKYFLKEELENINIENERKIIYSALSTAKKYLYISSQKLRGKSSFFSELSFILEKIMKTDNYSCCSDIETLDSSFAAANNRIIKSSFYSRNTCLVKKRAVAASFRNLTGKYFDSQKFNQYLDFLKFNYSHEKWWDYNENYKKNKKIPAFFKSNFSYSSIETYDSCPLKYKFAYYFKIIPESSFALINGRIYHEIIRKYFSKFLSGREEDPRELLENTVFEEIELNRDCFKYEFYLNEFKMSCLKHFNEFFENFVKILPVFIDKTFTKIPLIEESFNLNLGEDIKIIGKIDFINFLPENKIEIIDFKTSAAKMYEKDLEKELQLKLYRLAVERKSLNSSENIIPKGIELKYYYFYSKTNPVSIVSGKYYNENYIVSKIREITKKIQKEQFICKPRDFSSCMYCDYKILCPRYYAKPI